MRFDRKILATCAILFFLSQVLFLVNIQFPRGYDFDEFHYVPSAKQYLEMKENQNWEHPPLGKEIMAAGIALWGDRPIGWRYMSTVFGSLTLVAMYLWGFALFRDRKSALWVALITVSNQLLYVQARIGMLDTFMFAFVAWGMAAFTAAWDPELPARTLRRLLIFAGIMFGLATACKWWAVIPWFLTIGLVIVIRLLQYWKTSFGEATREDWYQADLWKGLRFVDFILALVIIPLAAYFVAFIPLFMTPGKGHGVLDFIEIQKRMYDGQLRVVTSHPYMSQWTDWAILKRPIWYAFDKEGMPDQWVRGVILLGNPLMMWTGLAAVLVCIWSWIRNRSREAFLITVCYGAFYLCWMAIPRKVSFYYYYYPAGMVLSFALAHVFREAEKEQPKMEFASLVYLAVSFGFFAYFFPILAALRISSDSFQKWMWFSSWI